MDCSVIEGELIPFHFGTLRGNRRDALEQHLSSCAKCLQAYLEVKRAVETGPGLNVRPSPLVRSRMRAEVAMEFGRKRHHAGRWVAAAAALLVAGATVLGVVTRHKPRVEPAPLAGGIDFKSEPVDTARPMDEPRFF